MAADIIEGEADATFAEEVAYDDGLTVDPPLPIPSRAIADATSLWQNCKTIRIQFLNSRSDQRDIVYEVAREYQSRTNIRFTYTSDQTRSDVRIAFDPRKGFWSHVGTLALRLSTSEATMNLGFTAGQAPKEKLGLARHEFGHLVGLVHEHQHPDRPRLNAEKAREFYWKVGIRNDEFDRQVMDKHTGPKYLTGEYDPKSIMHYEMPGHISEDGTAVEKNTELSRGDKKVLHHLYPRPKGPSRHSSSRKADSRAQVTTPQFQPVTTPDNTNLARSPSNNSWDYVDHGIASPLNSPRTWTTIGMSDARTPESVRLADIASQWPYSSTNSPSSTVYEPYESYSPEYVEDYQDQEDSYYRVQGASQGDWHSTSEQYVPRHHPNTL